MPDRGFVTARPFVSIRVLYCMKFYFSWGLLLKFGRVWHGICRNYKKEGCRVMMSDTV